ncbi:hypothetical protein AB0I28_26365 [Phytomonospora sp. NPDC050363]|uniref:hypothetical protein n=1 Tax=Phytomonospora sp. NPDC050363 TaxID=3155642 RepID=UPI0033EB53C6
MAVYRQAPGSTREPGTSPYARALDIRRFWTGCGITAAVAVAIAVTGFMVVRSVLQTPVLGVSVYAGVTEPSVLGYVVVVAAGTGVAGLLMYMLVMGSPRPLVYFRWIMALTLVWTVLLALFASDDRRTGLVTAGLNVLIGMVVWLGAVVAARLALRA